MSERQTLRTARERVQDATGVVVPVYLHDDRELPGAEDLIHDTVSSLVHELGRGDTICLAVDGSRKGEALARLLSEEYGVLTTFAERNRGKLSAAREGVSRLLDNADLHYLAVVDQDGDHFANELVSFVRAARHVEPGPGGRSVIVLGQRLCRHRPMGFLRGELEDLSVRVMMDALQFRAAKDGRPLPLQFVSVMAEYPDFHSGYKLFTRGAAESVFMGQPDYCGLSEDAYYRHACEAVMCVEAMLNDSILAVVHRTTFDEQPISIFGSMDRQQLSADMITWPCKRLGLPVEFVAQSLRNHLPRLLMGTLLPDGRGELLQVAKRVLCDLGGDGEAELSDDSIERMLFL